MDIENLSYDELIELHGVISELLDKKIAGEIRRIETCLDSLRTADAKPRRRYPQVVQRYCNPNDPSQTWNGRGRRPLWFVQLLRSGGDARHCEIRRAPMHVGTSDIEPDALDRQSERAATTI